MVVTVVKFLIFSIFINNPLGYMYSVIWCLYDPGKIKTPGDIPLGVVCFPQEKQKTPGAIHISLWFKLWILVYTLDNKFHNCHYIN